MNVNNTNIVQLAQRAARETLCVIKHDVHELVVSTQNAGHAPGSIELDCSESPTLSRLADAIHICGRLPLPFAICANATPCPGAVSTAKRSGKKAAAFCPPIASTRRSSRKTRAAKNILDVFH